MVLRRFLIYIRQSINRLSIFYKIVLPFILIIIIPMYISYYVSAETTQDIMIKRFSEEGLNTISIKESNINFLLNKMVSVVAYVDENRAFEDLIIASNQLKAAADMVIYEDRYNDYTIRKDIENFTHNMLSSSVNAKAYIKIITLSKRVYTNYFIGDNAEGNYGEIIEKAFLSFRNNIHWRGLEKNYALNDNFNYPEVITIEKTIANDASSKCYGMVVLSVVEKEFSNLLDANADKQNSIIIDQDNKIISSINKNLLGKKFNSIYEGQLPDENRGYVIADTSIGKNSMIVFNRIRNSNWTVVDIKDYTLFLSQIQQNKNRLLFLNLLFTIIFIVVAFIITKSITKPLFILSKQMRSIKSEDGSDYMAENNKNELYILKRSFGIMRDNINKLLEENKNKEKLKREAEVKALQAQINPHFMFNTLNAIRWAAINNNNQKAADMVFSLVNLLKMTINKGEEMVRLDQELQYIKHYAAILNMRHAMSFDLVIAVPEDIMEYKVPRLILQPLVENSVLHGFEKIKEGGRIEICGVKTDLNTILSVKDNGKGMELSSEFTEKSKQAKFSGIGVSNVDERIKLYYGEECGLTFISQPGLGTEVEIRLPLKWNEEVFKI